MVFGRKKESVQDIKTDVVEASVRDAPSPPPELKREYSKEELEMMEKVKAYNEYYRYFVGAGDVAGLPDTVLKSEVLNLLFAMFDKLKSIDETLKRLETKEA